MKFSHWVQTQLTRASLAFARGAPWPEVLARGTWIGARLYDLGIRRDVADANLKIAFPDWSPDERADVLRRHYEELGRVWVEYGRLAELARAPLGEVVTEVRNDHHVEEWSARRTGAVMLTGHFGNFELSGAFFTRYAPIDFVVKRMSNPGVEALIRRMREDAGVGVIHTGPGMRRAHAALQERHWVAMVGDQDAGRRGMFVPFMGRIASTAVGPARLAIQAGVPILMGFPVREDDGRYRIEVEEPLLPGNPDDPDAVRSLTLRHVAVLEKWIRRYPHMWFWLHRRWKTRPPEGKES